MHGKVTSYTFVSSKSQKTMTKDIEELMGLCDKQVKHWELLAKRLGFESSIKKRFPLYAPMRDALKRIRSNK